MNFQKMMKEAQALQKKMSELQAQLEHTEVIGLAGGGLIKVTTTAKGMLKKIEIDESIIVKEDKEMLEDLIVAAFNDASSKAESAMSNSMGSIGISPDMMKMMT